MTVEKKTFALEVKSVDEEQGIITGYLSTFNNIDLGNGYIRDRVRPGAFKRTISHALEYKNKRGKRYIWPHLWMHDPEHPLGGYIDAKEDEKGMLVTYQLDISKNSAGIPNNPTATMVFSGNKAGYIDELSIGYEVIKSELVEEVIDGKKTMVRDLIELRMREGSSVTSNFAMNPEAVVTGVKSASQTKKSFAEHLAEEMAEDLLEDWQDVLVCSLSCAVLDAFKGSNPEQDVRDALAQFSEAAMKWAAQGIEYNLSGYLTNNTVSYDASNAEYTMQYGSESVPMYGMMSRRTRLSHKAGRSISTANGGKIQAHIDRITASANEHEKAMKSHIKGLRESASELGSLLQSGDDDDSESPKGKSQGASYPRTRAPQPPSSDDTVPEPDIAAALASIKSLRTPSVATP